MAYYYEPRDYDLKKGWFPFRNNHFVVNSEKVSTLLCKQYGTPSNNPKGHLVSVDSGRRLSSRGISVQRLILVLVVGVAFGNVGRPTVLKFNILSDC